ncbi:MAG: hypothetical protein IPN29_14005 [Saprospiraceae bacterium]|nr:hypothetical protein [Saprospiraceae bacterium]
MKRIWLSCLIVGICTVLSAQIVSIDPANGGGDDEITLIFDAAQGNNELMGATSVYMHHGVVTAGINGTAWQYVKGNWGKDDGIGKMTKIGNDKWQIKYSPSVRAYFGVPAGTNIFRIACVFRSANGDKKGTIDPGNYGWGTVAANQDFYINLNSGVYVGIDQPAGNQAVVVPSGSTLPIRVSASSSVTEMKLLLDSGNGFVESATVSSGKALSYDYLVTASQTIKIRVEARINGQVVTAEKSVEIVIRNVNTIAALPTGSKAGINYPADSTTATLVLEAPGKSFVYAVGDFTNWKYNENYQMNVTPDGRYYWTTVTGLQPGKPYVFQYWVDGNIRIGDPYATQVADPWNDAYIEPGVFPNIPAYNKTEYGLATVLQTNKKPYNWSVSESLWQRPKVDNLVIYELHVRDFLKSHSYKDLTDTISYLKRLGIDAIELMPVNEFEGNDSWGYNPSYFFATDKYYGTADDLRKFIETCHQHGIAVIMDIVLNHAFGQNPMVQLYFDSGKPAANNPWFNREYVGQYQWGYDFNHESSYTKEFVDRVNRHWLEEFHFDGFRFDFTKGFTNNAPNGSVDGFDQSRINLIKRMGEKIWAYDKDAYIILEHWAPADEEKILGTYGFKMWRNRSYDFVPAITGANTGTFADMQLGSHVSYFDSHDEQRIAQTALTKGLTKGGYSVKQTEIMYERAKLTAAFAFLFPGPKMIWQFDELGYDIDIDFNGRLGRKPLPWGPDGLGYYEDELRQHIYESYQGILEVRNKIGPDKLAAATTGHKLTGNTRRLVFNTSGIDLVVIGNFGLAEESVSPNFPVMGKWYNYFEGDSIVVTNGSTPITLQAGEWEIYTTKRLSEGRPDVVEVFQNPVTITPVGFTQDDLITVTFDAKKASKAGTNGLIDANKVYFHSGVIKNLNTNALTNVVGTFKDDGVGQMTYVGDNKWQISFVPAQYYGVSNSEDIYKLVKYFRDGPNENLGKGFRNRDIVFEVASNDPFVTLDPPSFDLDEEITIVFDASQGNRELVNSDKIYMHSGVGIVNTTSPQSSAWNKVKGNWGQDDGVGKMTKIPGTNLWKITLKPRTYYGLKDGEFPYWIAAVFRNADGSIKGTGTPGSIASGFIASNQDFFLKNQGTVAVVDTETDTSSIGIYPNPSDGRVNFRAGEGEKIFRLFRLTGEKLVDVRTTESSLNLPDLPTALYLYELMIGGTKKVGLLEVR